MGDFKKGSKKIKNRFQDSWTRRWRVFHGKTPVGWHYGYALSPEGYFMQSSFIDDKYRGQGLYSKMLELTIEKARGKGFQLITGYHHPNNPAILIPKLKKGFVITGTSINEGSSFMIEMKLYLDPVRKKNLAKTVGIPHLES